jgi:rhodanese-related sulfurtransferase
MSFFSVFLLLALLISTQVSQAAPIDAVKPKWRTPYDLYLTPREAYQKKLADGDATLLIDVRTRAEVKFIGIADAVDANIPVRMLRDDYAWSEKSATYRTRENPDFVAAVERLLESRGLNRQSPVILMCQSGSRAPTGRASRRSIPSTRVSRASRLNREPKKASGSSTAGKTRNCRGVTVSRPARCTSTSPPEPSPLNRVMAAIPAKAGSSEVLTI